MEWTSGVLQLYRRHSPDCPFYGKSRNAKGGSAKALVVDHFQTEERAREAAPLLVCVGGHELAEEPGRRCSSASGRCGQTRLSRHPETSNGSVTSSGAGRTLAGSIETPQRRCDCRRYRRRQLSPSSRTSSRRSWQRVRLTPAAAKWLRESGAAASAVLLMRHSGLRIRDAATLERSRMESARGFPLTLVD